MRALATIFIFFTVFIISVGCIRSNSLNYSVREDTSSPPSFQIADKRYGINFLLQSDDFLREHIIGVWECQIVAQNYIKTAFITNAGKTITSHQQQETIQSKLIFRKSGEFEIIQEPILNLMRISANTGTWHLQNGVVFIDLKIKYPDFPNLKNIKLSAIPHINSAGNLILHWDTASAENIARKISHKNISFNPAANAANELQFFYGSNNCFYALYNNEVETFQPVHTKIETIFIGKLPQLEYRRVRNEKISQTSVLSDNAVTREGQGALRASHILITVTKGSDGSKEFNKANAIYAQLFLSPERFGEFAVQYSDCPSKTKNGYIGYFDKGQMLPEFEEATLALKENQISKPVKTNLGWHIIKREKLY